MERRIRRTRRGGKLRHIVNVCRGAIHEQKHASLAGSGLCSVGLCGRRGRGYPFGRRGASRTVCSQAGMDRGRLPEGRRRIYGGSRCVRRKVDPGAARQREQRGDEPVVVASGIVAPGHRRGRDTRPVSDLRGADGYGMVHKKPVPPVAGQGISGFDRMADRRPDHRGGDGCHRDWRRHGRRKR